MAPGVPSATGWPLFLSIASTVMPGLVGGSVKGVKSLFSPEEVTTLVTTLTTEPSPIGTLVVNQGKFDLTVEVREDGDLVNGVQVTLALEANNGTTNSIQVWTPSGCNGGVPSGVTGAGNSPRADLLFGEVTENFRAYAVGNEHRHLPEMRATVAALGGDVDLLFTPHLLPVARGILATITVPPRTCRSSRGFSESRGSLVRWITSCAGDPGRVQTHRRRP